MGDPGMGGLIDLNEHYGDVWDLGLCGAGVLVVVPDTFLPQGAVSEFNAEMADRLWGRPFGRVRSVDLKGAQPETSNTNDHAYQVLSLITKIAGGADVLHLSVFNPTCEVNDLLHAFDIAVENRADIVNLSLGMPIRSRWLSAAEKRANSIDENIPVRDLQQHLKECSLCKRATTLTLDHDILVVAAVGNWAKEAIACPAIAPNVCSVGSFVSERDAERYRLDLEEETKDFLAGRVSTSFATANMAGQLALLGSAFPGISADALNSIVSAIQGGGITGNKPRPVRARIVFEQIREICNHQYLNIDHWRELQRRGIATRRALIDAAQADNSLFFRHLRTMIQDQRQRADNFVAAVKSDVRQSRSAPTISQNPSS